MSDPTKEADEALKRLEGAAAKSESAWDELEASVSDWSSEVSKPVRWPGAVFGVAACALTAAAAVIDWPNPDGPIFSNPALMTTPYNPAYLIAFAQLPQLAPCSAQISGVDDYECTTQCLVWGDGGVNCYYPDGGPTGTMTQSNAFSTSSSGFMLGDGGWLTQWEFPNDTGGTAGLAQVDSPDIRGLLATQHTIVYQGYMGSTGPDPSGWFAMITDATNVMQLRRGGTNNLQMVESPGSGVASSGGDCLDNYCVIMGKREVDGGFNVQQGGNKSTTVGTTAGAVTGSNKLILGGGIGGCCAPAGSQGGQFVALTLYHTAKADSWYQQVNRAAHGAQALASGQNSQVGNLGVRRARYDLDKPGGGVPVYGVGGYLMDPVTGTITNQTFHVLGPVDSLDGGKLVGSCTWRGKFDKGPFFPWRHQNSAGVLSAESAGACGEELGSVGGDGGIIDTNAYFIGTAFTDAGYAMNSTYWIQNICTGGTIDGGFDHCAGTVLGNGVFAAYPRWGCPMICAGATGVVKSILYVGDAGATGALEVGHIQMTDTLEWQDPSVTNAQVSAQWDELDAGAFIPQGPGKICVIYQTQYASSWYPSTLNSTQPPGTGSYLFDISNPATGATHDMMMWLTTEIQADGGYAPLLDALLYGNDPNYITPNKFSAGGQYFGAPNVNTTGTFYIACSAWDLENGTLPDGGPGQGSRLIQTADTCGDQTHPYACIDATVVNQNTGQLGLPPGTPLVFQVGTRASGSAPSTTRDHHMNVCTCSGSKCSGPCL